MEADAEIVARAACPWNTRTIEDSTEQLQEVVSGSCPSLFQEITPITPDATNSMSSVNRAWSSSGRA